MRLWWRYQIYPTDKANCDIIAFADDAYDADDDDPGDDIGDDPGGDYDADSASLCLSLFLQLVRFHQTFPRSKTRQTSQA